MSIEDVDYMKKNSIKETYTFIVDSSKRNIDEYPEPNEYVVNFDIPFKNVFGIEIMEVSVPKTMYNVDTDSNKLYIYLNTTLQPIDNIENLCYGNQWIEFNQESNISKKYLNNNDIEDKLYYIINNYQNLEGITDLSKIDNIHYDFENYKITNLNNSNYIKIANSELWKKTTDIDDYIYNEIYEPDISSNISLNIDSDSYNNNIILTNLRSDNSIPVINYNYSNYYLEWYKNNSFISNYNFSNYGYNWEKINSIINNDKANDITDTNTKLVELLKTKESSDNILLRHYEIFDNNIDLSYINNNSYIRLDNGIYKPKSLFSVGTLWKVYSNKEDIHNFDNYKPYKNDFLENNIIEDININELDLDIENLEFKYTMDELNTFSYDFDLNFESYLELYTSVLWESDKTNSIGTIEINNGNFFQKINNFKSLIRTNLNINKNKFVINDIEDIKNDLITLINNNKNSIHYIIVNGIRFIQQKIYVIPKNDNFWLINKNLKNSIKKNFDNSLNKAIIPVKKLSGLNWLNIGSTKPILGPELVNPQLSEALGEKTRFTPDEWLGFNIVSLRVDHFVKSGNDYFKPVDEPVDEQVDEPVDEPVDEWINIDNLLTPYNFIKIDNDFYKLYPSYIYKPEINYYIPNDLIDIKNKDNYKFLLKNYFELFEIKLDIGNYNINKLLIQLNKKIEENIINEIKNRHTNNFFLDKENYEEITLNFKGNSDPIDLQNILKIESNRYIIFDMKNSTIDKTLGFYSKTKIDNNNNYYYIDINKEKEFNKFFHSIYNDKSFLQEIIAPGILYLIGTDYVVLRCPEIEKHLYGSLSYTQNTMGLAKIKVSSWGLNEDSNTYLKLKLREFHPIGKLAKMTLKFEKGDTYGELYNFRGVNHNLVFTIHYYSPAQNKEFNTSVINPEYDMNFMKYKYSDDNKEDNSDDDNDIIDLNEYKKKELEFSNKKYNTNNVFDYEKIRNDLYNKDTHDTDDSENLDNSEDSEDSDDY